MVADDVVSPGTDERIYEALWSVAEKVEGQSARFLQTLDASQPIRDAGVRNFKAAKELLARLIARGYARKSDKPKGLWLLRVPGAAAPDTVRAAPHEDLLDTNVVYAYLYGRSSAHKCVSVDGFKPPFVSDPVHVISHKFGVTADAAAFAIEAMLLDGFVRSEVSKAGAIGIRLMRYLPHKSSSDLSAQEQSSGAPAKQKE